jgi:hypothetical protein
MSAFIEFMTGNEKLVSSIIAIIGMIITLATFIKAVLEYRAQGSQRRAEYFLKFKNELITEEWAVSINKLVEMDLPQLCDVDLMLRYRYLGLFETISISHNSGLISRQTVYYMFGYFAIRCYESIYFWDGINKDSPYWAEFCRFALEMKEMEKQVVSDLNRVSDCRCNFSRVLKF